MVRQLFRSFTYLFADIFKRVQVDADVLVLHFTRVLVNTDSHAGPLERLSPLAEPAAGAAVHLNREAARPAPVSAALARQRVQTLALVRHRRQWVRRRLGAHTTRAVVLVAPVDGTGGASGPAPGRLQLRLRLRRCAVRWLLGILRLRGALLRDAGARGARPVRVAKGQQPLALTSGVHGEWVMGQTPSGGYCSSPSPSPSPSRSVHRECVHPLFIHLEEKYLEFESIHHQLLKKKCVQPKCFTYATEYTCTP